MFQRNTGIIQQRIINCYSCVSVLDKIMKYIGQVSMIWFACDQVLLLSDGYMLCNYILWIFKSSCKILFGIDPNCHVYMFQMPLDGTSMLGEHTRMA